MRARLLPSLAVMWPNVRSLIWNLAPLTEGGAPWTEGMTQDVIPGYLRSGGGAHATFWRCESCKIVWPPVLRGHP